jgi:ATP-dependent RNA helicase RhlE
MNQLNKFEEILLKLDPSVKKTLIEDEKITSFTPIQELTIPSILDGKSVVGLSETGSGKTLAFLVPTISQLIGTPKKNIKLLILTATKELALQILTVVKKCTRHNTLLSELIIGGDNINEQIRSINKGVQIIVATPGRLQEIIFKEGINLSEVDTIIFDEADVMMDMGYFPQLEVIYNECTNIKKALMFSATMSEEAQKLSENFINNPLIIRLNENQSKKSIEELFCPIDQKLKIPFLKFLFKEEKIKSGLVFCNTKEGARSLYEELLKAEYKVALIEGEMSTHQRKKALDLLRNKSIRILIATDVASRGIDITHLTHVINFEVPLNKDSYIHRIGRTARYEGIGKAITLYRPTNDEKNLERIIDSVRPHKYKNFKYDIIIKKK